MATMHPVARPRREAAGAVSDLARRKLEAFARIEEEFIASFRFVEEVHGQRRFTTFSVADTARYLHALYICECKDQLLSVPNTARRYEGARCLELLRDWQEGHTAGVVAFIHERLDDLPFGELSQQIEDVAQSGDIQLIRRLISGRVVLLNRLFTLAYALDAIFALDPKPLRAEVRAACKRYGHTRAEIERQLADARSDLYTYAPHPALARRNMIVMNGVGLRLTDADGERPGERTDRVRPPVLPVAPYAEEVIPGATTQVSLRWRWRAVGG